MPPSLPPEVALSARNRRALLWVCQRYDLIAAAEPHRYSAPETDVAPLYRSELTEADRRLAGLYWEAAWLEGARSPVLAAMRARGWGGRHLVVLSSEAEASASISSQEFLLVHVLPGSLDPGTAPDGRYGTLRERQRERAAWELGARLQAYQSRVLVVVGAEYDQDLQFLYQLLEDLPIVDLRVLIVWPPGRDAGTIAPETAARIDLWRGSADGLVDALASEGAPTAGEVPTWAVRLGRGLI